MKLLIDMGTQTSILTQQDAEKLRVQPGQQIVKISRMNRASVVCSTVKINLWLPGKKCVRSIRFAVKDHNENILCFDVLNG